MSAVENKILFDYVLVVSLQNDTGAAKPYVSYRFPPSQVNGKENNKDNLANAIMQFCFPEADQWLDSNFAKKKKEEKGETFSFVLPNQTVLVNLDIAEDLLSKVKKETLFQSVFASLVLFLQLDSFQKCWM